MEVDAVKWITDVELAGEKNARNLTRLNVQMDQVTVGLADHREDSKNRSDERLDLIMDRFDRLEKAQDKRDAKTLAAKRLWIPLAISSLIGLGGLVKLSYIDPLTQRLDALERRIKYVEQVNTLAVVDSGD